MKKLTILLFILYSSIIYSQDSSIMIVSPNDEDTIFLYNEGSNSSLAWGALQDIEYGEGAISTTDGEQNTSDIVGELDSNSAAYVCDTLTEYGYSDWYLPSLQELRYVYLQGGDSINVVHGVY